MCTRMDKIKMKDNRASRANFILYVMQLLVTVLLYAICGFRHGRFFSGIDYAGHGAWGWIGLWFTCAWAATILSIAIMWIFKLNIEMSMKKNGRPSILQNKPPTRL